MVKAITIIGDSKINIVSEHNVVVTARTFVGLSKRKRVSEHIIVVKARTIIGSCKKESIKTYYTGESKNYLWTKQKGKECIRKHSIGVSKSYTIVQPSKRGRESISTNSSGESENYLQPC